MSDAPPSADCRPPCRRTLADRDEATELIQALNGCSGPSSSLRALALWLRSYSKAPTIGCTAITDVVGQSHSFSVAEKQ